MNPFIIILIIVSLVEAGMILRLARSLNKQERRVRKMLDRIEARHLKGGGL